MQFRIETTSDAEPRQIEKILMYCSIFIQVQD